MINPLTNWWTRLLNDPQILALLLVLVGSYAIIALFGAALAPFLTAVVVAYLMEGVVRWLTSWRVPRSLAVALVFSLFMVLLLAFLFVVIPNLAGQLSRLLNEVPRIITTLKALLHQVMDQVAKQELVNPTIIDNLLSGSLENSQTLLTNSIAYLMHWIPGLLSVLIYLILVPFLVFFFLKDKDLLLSHLARFMPKERALLLRVYLQVEIGLGGYIRGKFWELFLLAAISYWVFALLHFDYAFLLGWMTGLSVLIPFLGVAAVTVPVAILGLVQWGLSWEAIHPLIAYIILQVIDGSILVPIILGETMAIHPTTIVLAVLFFGYFWGILGVFFAVPLAVVVTSVLESVPFPDISDQPNDFELTD